MTQSEQGEGVVAAPFVRVPVFSHGFPLPAEDCIRIPEVRVSLPHLIHSISCRLNQGWCHLVVVWVLNNVGEAAKNQPQYTTNGEYLTQHQTAGRFGGP